MFLISEFCLLLKSHIQKRHGRGDPPSPRLLEQFTPAVPGGCAEAEGGVKCVPAGNPKFASGMQRFCSQNPRENSPPSAQLLLLPGFSQLGGPGRSHHVGRPSVWLPEQAISAWNYLGVCLCLENKPVMSQMQLSPVLLLLLREEGEICMRVVAQVS